MSLFSIISLVIKWASTVKSIIDEASSNDSIVTKIKTTAPEIVPILENAGNELFPNVAPELHIAAGAMATFDPNMTKWLQGVLNKFLVPSPNLLVDGIYGKLTIAAVKQAQTKLGIKVDGWAGQITQAALQSVLGGK